jgi:hypothetical protein
MELVKFPHVASTEALRGELPQHKKKKRLEDLHAHNRTQQHSRGIGPPAIVYSEFPLQMLLLWDGHALRDTTPSSDTCQCQTAAVFRGRRTAKSRLHIKSMISTLEQ